MKFLVIIGDLVKSRKIPKRIEFQNALEAGLDRLSRDRKDMASPYTITLGDEFQAVYKKAWSQNALLFLFGLLLSLHEANLLIRYFIEKLQLRWLDYWV